MATTLRSWDAPSSRVAASVSANQAINGWMAKYGQQRLNRRLKKQVRQTGFVVKTWEARAHARAGALTSYAQSVQQTGANLQVQSQDIEHLAAGINMLTEDFQQKIRTVVDPQRRKEMTRNYRQEFRQRKTVLRGAQEQFTSQNSAYTGQVKNIKTYEKRLTTGQKRLKQAQRRNIAAVEKYNERYYPVTPGFTY